MEPFETIILTLNEPNLNNHLYPATVVQGAIDNLGGREVLGGLLDPSGHALAVDLSRVTHQVTDMHIDGNAVYGTIKILNTPLSNIVSALVEEKVGGFRISCTCNTTKHDDGVIEISDMAIRSVDYCKEPA